MKISGDRKAFISFLPTPSFLLLPGQEPSRRVLENSRLVPISVLCVCCRLGMLILFY